MLRNYLRIAFRNLVRNRVFSIINIIGLAIGLACSILIFLWVQDELSADRFHENGDQVYRVLQDIVFEDEVTWAITQGPLAPSLADDFPEIEAFHRIAWYYAHYYHGEDMFKLLGCLVDSSFFEFFSIPMLKGNPSKALIDPHSIVLTETTAKEIFGDEDPMDQIIGMNDEFEFKVTGVISDMPGNSILKDFNYLIPFHFADEVRYNPETWGNSQFYSFLKLSEGSDPTEINAKIGNYLKEKPTLEEHATLRLQSLGNIWLHSQGFDFDFETGDIKYVYIFSVIAAFILIIACVNFMNLTTARASRRMREISLRKISGAGRNKLILQILLESLVLILIASLLAIIMVELIRPYFNQLSGKDLELDYSSPIFLGSIGLIVIISVLLSGIYPAMVISGFSPLSILRGAAITGHGRSMFRKILVIFQFSISVILIISTLIVDRQYEFLRNKNLGYDSENLVSIPKWEGFYEHYQTVKDRILEHPSIINVTTTAQYLTQTYSYSNSLWDWDGKNDDDEVLLRASFVGYDYFETLDLQIHEGRFFSRDFASDTVTSVIINETAAKVMGLADPVGQSLTNQDQKYIIIGIVKDYHFRSLHSAIEPLIIICRPDYCRYLIARLVPLPGDNGTGVQDGLEHLNELWDEYVKDSDFACTFISERIEREYTSEKQIRQIARSFSMLAILISSLGLFGLALFMAETRTKEIGIRKVNGASNVKVMFLLTMDFSKWVLISMLIAVPISWLGMSKWLQNFPYRISMSVDLILLAGFIALAISWVTVAYHAWYTANKNPVDSLRYE